MPTALPDPPPRVRPRPDPPRWLSAHPAHEFDTGEILIESMLLRTAEIAATGPNPPPPKEDREEAFVAYIVEGLVRGVWNERPMAPSRRATIIVSGDGRWVGADAFKYGKNLYRYAALAPTTAAVVPLAARRGNPRQAVRSPGAGMS